MYALVYVELDTFSVMLFPHVIFQQLILLKFSLIALLFFPMQQAGFIIENILRAFS